MNDLTMFTRMYKIKASNVMPKPYGMGHKKVPVSVFIKTVFILATETERLGHGTVRSTVN